MKIKPLLFAGVLALSSATPALAHGGGHHYHPTYEPVHTQPYQPIPGPSNNTPSVLGTILGIGVIGAGLWWNYGPDIEYEYDDKTYVICNDFGRRYYC